MLLLPLIAECDECPATIALILPMPEAAMAIVDPQWRSAESMAGWLLPHGKKGRWNPLRGGPVILCPKCNAKSRKEAR